MPAAMAATSLGTPLSAISDGGMHPVLVWAGRMGAHVRAWCGWSVLHPCVLHRHVSGLAWGGGVVAVALGLAATQGVYCVQIKPTALAWIDGSGAGARGAAA